MGSTAGPRGSRASPWTGGFARDAAGLVAPALVPALRYHRTDTAAASTTSRAATIHNGARDPRAGSGSAGGAGSDPRRKSSSGSMVCSRFPCY